MRCLTLCGTLAIFWFAPALAAPQLQFDQLPSSPKTIDSALADIRRAEWLLERHIPFDPVLTVINRSLSWLEKKLEQNEPENYRLNLTQDAFLLLLAAQNPQAWHGVIEAVAIDLDLKARDCERYGHGRLVPVEVRTLKNSQPDNGWRIQYVWVPTEGKIARDMWFPAPSSPATWQLPPGSYVLSAQKTVDGKPFTVPGGVLPVGGKDKVVWTIAVP